MLTTPLTSTPSTQSPPDKTPEDSHKDEDSTTASPSSTTPAQPKKKRKLDSNTASITLPREDLLSYSSEEFEKFVSDISEKRDLSASDQNELKRQRRLIKNRESAHASRLRKKSHVENLEKQVADLVRENGNLKNNITALMQENSNLKSEVLLLTSGKSVGVGASPSMWGGNYFAPFARPSMTSGVKLFVLLFAFGLFMNVPLGYQKAGMPYGAGSPVRVLGRSDYKTASQEANILSVLAEQQEIPLQRLEKAYQRHLETANQKTELDSTISDLLELEPPKQLSCPTPESVMATLPKELPVGNSSSMLCDNLNQILSNTLQQQNDDCKDQPLLISFVFPETLPQPKDRQDEPIPQNLYEVLCEVKP
uniref:BZIP domain-containing protein n=1 Tax=Arcella intermedia TaxID=1963864 RepID=A0A6B2L797_9EUKA